MTSTRPKTSASRQEADLRVALRPLLGSSLAFYAFMGVLSVLLLGWLLAVVYQTTKGHGVQGLGTKGAIWGIIVANIVHLIGISHVGIAISASVRIMKLKRYMALARIAELVTLVSMTAAVMNIALDVGRPDRFLANVVLHGRIHGPFVWSMTVIFWYVVGSSVYLYLAMRRDLAICSMTIPRRRWLYRLLSIGYTDTPEIRETHHRTVWWCAVIILPIMVSVHSVYGFVFGLQAGRPGWFNPIMAPYFVLGAIVSGFSAMIIIVAIVRKIYRWHENIPDRTFKGLGIFLGFVTWLYMYFLFSELLTGQYGPPEADHALWSDVLWGRFAWFAWPTFIGGLFIPFWLLFVQGCNPKICSVPLTVVAALFINLALWMIRFLIVVPSFYTPLLPYRLVPYHPTFVEISVMLGTWVFAIFLFSLLMKICPVVELPEEIRLQGEKSFILCPRLAVGRVFKRVLVLGTVGCALGLMVYGFATWSADYAPVKWLGGISLLCVVPLEICLLTSGRERSPERELRLVTAPRPGVVSVDRWVAAPTPAIGPLTGRARQP